MEYVNNNIKPHNNVFLIVEDNPVDAEIVRGMLEEAYQNNFKMIWVECFEDAENILATKSIDALILDMNLPYCSGPANVTELNKKYPHLPIVVLTGYDDQAVALESIQFGAQDFLVKNDISSQILARSLHYAKERKKLEITLKQSYDELSHKNGELESIARTDYLTQLPNRSYFESSIQRCIEQAKRSNKEFALLYVDLNDFKKINDRLGHAVGDELLVVVAQRLRSVVRDTDFIARIGGDEFVIFTDLLHSKDEDTILYIQLQLETAQSFANKKEKQQLKPLKAFKIHSDDVFSFINDNEPPQLTCTIAITESEQSLVNKQVKILGGLLQIKLQKVLNIIAKQLNLKSI